MYSSKELQHWGVKGMKWGVRKPEAPASPSLARIRASQAIRIGTTVAGVYAQRNAKTILKKAPKTIIKGTIAGVKLTASALRNTRRMATGAKFALRVLGATGRGARSYVRGTVSVVKALR